MNSSGIGPGYLLHLFLGFGCFFYYGLCLFLLYVLLRKALINVFLI